MNFSYGIIGIVGVLAAISIGFIAIDPTDVIEPRDVSPSPLVPAPDPIPEPTPPIVLIPAGSGVPGCDETDECYLPYEITVPASTTVFWTNDDSTVHTVTSKSASDTGVPIFDSGLISSGSDYEFTFNDAGSFDYYCIVHPWMIGIVDVQ